MFGTRTQVLPGPATLLGGAGLYLMPVPLLLGRAWPPWAHQAALVSGDIRFSTLSCHGHPQAASAAAWLNNSSSLLYSSLPGCEWLSKPHHSPPGPAALAFTPSPAWPPESCPRTGPCARAMNQSGLLWRSRVNTGAGGASGHSVDPMCGKEGARGSWRWRHRHPRLHPS